MIECDMVYEQGQCEHFEILKQVFWLNVLNYMTLCKIAEIILVRPASLK